MIHHHNIKNKGWTETPRKFKPWAFMDTTNPWPVLKQITKLMFCHVKELTVKKETVIQPWGEGQEEEELARGGSDARKTTTALRRGSKGGAHRRRRRPQRGQRRKEDGDVKENSGDDWSVRDDSGDDWSVREGNWREGGRRRRRLMAWRRTAAKTSPIVDEDVRVRLGTWRSFVRVGELGISFFFCYNGKTKS
jgi:hypothetical protein